MRNRTRSCVKLRLTERRPLNTFLLTFMLRGSNVVLLQYAFSSHIIAQSRGPFSQSTKCQTWSAPSQSLCQPRPRTPSGRQIKCPAASLNSALWTLCLDNPTRTLVAHGASSPNLCSELPPFPKYERQPRAPTHPEMHISSHSHPLTPPPPLHHPRLPQQPQPSPSPPPNTPSPQP